MVNGGEDLMKAEMRKILEANRLLQEKGDGEDSGNVMKANGTIGFAVEVEDDDEEVKANGDHSNVTGRNTQSNGKVKKYGSDEDNEEDEQYVVSENDSQGSILDELNN